MSCGSGECGNQLDQCILNADFELDLSHITYNKMKIIERAQSLFVYKIPYRRAPRLAFRPSASREQRYLAYKVTLHSNFEIFS